MITTKGERNGITTSEVCDMFQYVMRFGAWAHYGFGYGMGVMFQMKYVVAYGLGRTLARAEQMRTPNHPKCIGRIHLYSDMWRHFDQGLYFFLRKYVVIVIQPSLTFERRVKSRLPFAGIISSPYSTRFQDKG